MINGIVDHLIKNKQKLPQLLCGDFNTPKFESKEAVWPKEILAAIQELSVMSQSGTPLNDVFSRNHVSTVYSKHSAKFIQMIILHTVGSSYGNQNFQKKI